jgi:hypothetical protein
MSYPLTISSMTASLGNASPHLTMVPVPNPSTPKINRAMIITGNTVEYVSNCMDCPHHQVVADPDPTDWFCDDDIAVLC